MSSHLEVEYFIELAENSLALGDSDAALNLLDQIPDEFRLNRWKATQVEALRLHSEFEACRELATLSINRMIDEGDWQNARRVLLEIGRVADELSLNREAIQELHQIEVRLRAKQETDPLFHSQLFLMLASRILFEGDVVVAKEIVGLVDVFLTKVHDRRLLASIYWVKGDIADKVGDIYECVDFFERALGLFQEEQDALAVARAVGQLATCVMKCRIVSFTILERTLSWVVRVRGAHLGDSNTSSAMYLSIYEANLRLKMGQYLESVELLDAVVRDCYLPDDVLAWVHLTYALCEIGSGNVERARWFLGNARALLESSSEREEGKFLLRLLGHTYIDLGDVQVGLAMLDQYTTEPSDFSWCIPVVAT